ncbi:MAG: hypothetical protein ACHP78_03875 [Terriglobales bacterium]
MAEVGGKQETTIYKLLRDTAIGVLGGIVIEATVKYFDVDVLFPVLPYIWLGIIGFLTFDVLKKSIRIENVAVCIYGKLSERSRVISYLVIFAIGGCVFAGYWWGISKVFTHRKTEGHATIPESIKHPQLIPEDQPGPGPLTGMTDSVSVVVTPATPKGGAMMGGFKTTGAGEYEVDILNVTPEELLFEPPGTVVKRNRLPADLTISGHKMTIRRFTDKGFVIFDNGWRDITVSVALIKADRPQQPESKTVPAVTVIVPLTPRHVNAEQLGKHLMAFEGVTAAIWNDGTNEPGALAKQIEIGLGMAKWNLQAGGSKGSDAAWFPDSLTIEVSSKTEPSQERAHQAAAALKKVLKSNFQIDSQIRYTDQAFPENFMRIKVASQ